MNRKMFGFLGILFLGVIVIAALNQHPVIALILWLMIGFTAFLVVWTSDVKLLRVQSEWQHLKSDWLYFAVWSVVSAILGLISVLVVFTFWRSLILNNGRSPTE